jgi:hypothetical protein
MFMGAYMDVWYSYLQESQARVILPLYIASGQFGAIYKFLGIAMPEKQVTTQKPDKMTVSHMRDLMWKFIKANPVTGFGVPLTQLVEELKVGKPQEVLFLAA